MREITLGKLNELIENGNGYVNTTELLKVGFTNRQIAELVKMGELEKVAHGHYWLLHSKFCKIKEYKAVEIGLINPNAVICADSACFYHGLINIEPEVLSIATRRTDRHNMDMNFEINRHYYSEKNFEEDCFIRTTEQGKYKIYNIERSVCDCIRFQESIEKEVFHLVIENYQKSTKKQIERLKAYARNMRVERKVEEVLNEKKFR